MLMILRRLLLVSFVLWSLVSIGWSAQRVESQNFILAVGGTVVVDTSRGAVEVVPGEGRDVLVAVSMLSPTDDQMKHALHWMICN